MKNVYLRLSLTTLQPDFQKLVSLQQPQGSHFIKAQYMTIRLVTVYYACSLGSSKYGFYYNKLFFFLFILQQPVILLSERWEMVGHADF